MARAQMVDYDESNFILRTPYEAQFNADMWATVPREFRTFDRDERTYTIHKDYAVPVYELCRQYFGEVECDV